MEDGRDLGFSYRERKSGEIELLRGGRIVTRLRGERAQTFLAALSRTNGAGAQQLMARLTGNYKRGNEHLAGRQARQA